MNRTYPAIIDKDEGSDYGISFPDFPGCVSAGATIEEAVAMGTEALSFHMAGMAEDGETIPDPTPIEALQRDADLPAPVVVVMITVVVPGRAKRINVSLDESLIEEIDRVAANRSGFLANAARTELARLKTHATR